MALQVDKTYLTETLRDLVQINSVNPAFSDGVTNEMVVAQRVAAELEHLGTQLTTIEAAAGRPSVVGRLSGRGGGPSLLLYGHLDTVGVEEMPNPFGAVVRDGRMYGRGTYDMKGGVAACLGAVKAIRDAGLTLAGDLFVTGVADEEVASTGMTAVLDQVRPDAAVVTEATHLRVCRSHKGFCWVAVETHGRAAHGSRFEEGIDANLKMGRVLAQLEQLEGTLRLGPRHPLLGPRSMHAGVLRGGTGPSTYAARCRVEIERRTLPGETEVSVVADIQAVVDALATADRTFRASVEPMLFRPSFDGAPDSRIAATVIAASGRTLRHPPEIIGEPYWMDAALLAAHDVDTVVIGPVGAGAHAAEEWVDLESVGQLAEILADTAVAFCGLARGRHR
jgi:acetylornithine deacetylase